MKINYTVVAQWLEQRAATACTVAELKHLAQLIVTAIDTATSLEDRRKTALEQATKIAREFGFESIDELRSETSADSRGTPADGRGTRSGLRKPHLDPLDPDACELLAITKMRPDNYPKWVKERLEQGFTIDELHFRNHAQGLARLGLGEPRYDAVVRHKELVTQAGEPK